MNLKKDQMAYIAGAVVAVVLMAGGLYLLLSSDEEDTAVVTPLTEEVIAVPAEPALVEEPARPSQSLEDTNQDDQADDVTRIVIGEGLSSNGADLGELLGDKIIINNEVVGADGQPLKPETETETENE